MVKSKSPSSCPCVSICRGVPFKSLLSSRRRLFAPAFSLGILYGSPNDNGAYDGYGSCRNPKSKVATRPTDKPIAGA